MADHRLASPGNSWTDKKKKDGNSECLLMNVDMFWDGEKLPEKGQHFD